MHLRLIAASLLAMQACGAGELERHEFESPQMGTLFKIILYAPEVESAKRAADSAFSLAAKLNRSFSDYEADSELMRLVANGQGTASAELFDILSIARKIAEDTGGAFDVSTAAHTRNWRRARITGKLPTQRQIAEAKASSGWRKLRLEEDGRQVTLEAAGMKLDLGGIAKGYAADAILAQLKHDGFPIASVAAGGDIAVGDPPPGSTGWKIAIAPGGDSGARQTLTLANRAISTSGDAEQNVLIEGKTYSHIVDPETGLGLTQSSAVSVIGDCATDTDAFATAFSIVGKERSAPIALKRGLEVIWGQP